MAKRFRMNARDFEPRQARYAIDERTHAESVKSAREHRKTVASVRNPWHEGLHEAKTCRTNRVALNGAPHPSDVAVDRRIRQQERDRERHEAHCRKLHRKLDIGLQTWERKHGRLD